MSTGCVHCWIMPMSVDSWCQRLNKNPNFNGDMIWWLEHLWPSCTLDWEIGLSIRIRVARFLPDTLSVIKQLSNLISKTTIKCMKSAPKVQVLEKGNALYLFFSVFLSGENKFTAVCTHFLLAVSAIYHFIIVWSEHNLHLNRNERHPVCTNTFPLFVKAFRMISVSK